MDYRIPASILALIITFIFIEKLARVIINLIEFNKINQYCDSFTGEVQSGDYYYRRVSSENLLHIKLQPLSGDPDLYISYSNYPTYNLKDHDQSSCTCGEEEIITTDVKENVYVGVYCYNIFYSCFFHLHICPMPQTNITTEIPLKLKSDDSKNTKEDGKHKLKSTFLTLIEVLVNDLFPLIF